MTAGSAGSGGGQGGGTSQAPGGSSQSAGTSSSAAGKVEAGAGTVGASADAGQPSSAEAGAASEWPTSIVNEFGFALEDSWLLMPCLEAIGSDRFCRPLLAECPNEDATDVEQRGYRFVERFQLGGELGSAYDVTLDINGIAEGKYYEGGVRRDGNNFASAHQPMGADAWYTGGNPVISTYSIYKLTVFEPDGVTEVEHYYLNSFPQESGLESHQTVLLGYQATITVPGQGIVEYLVVEPDCYAINNCGLDPVAHCDFARMVPNQPGLLLPETYGGKPIATLDVLNGGVQPFNAQVLHVVVTNVVAK